MKTLQSDEFTMTFGGNNFDGVIMKPMIYNQRKIIRDILNEFECKTNGKFIPGDSKCNEDVDHYLFNVNQ